MDTTVRFFLISFAPFSNPLCFRTGFIIVALVGTGGVGMSYEIPIYLINLDSRLDRLDDCEVQAMKNNLNFQRISATMPPEILPANTLISPPAYACLQSHLNTLETFLATEDSHALILEDDFEIVNARAFAGFLITKNYLNFDFVQLGFLRMGVRHRLDLATLKVENLLVRSLIQILRTSPNSSLFGRLRIRRNLEVPSGFIPDDIRSGAHCYIVSRDFAKVILKLNNPAFLTIDSLYGSLPWNHHFRMIRTSKPWVGQSKSKSSIKTSGRRSEL